MFELLHRDGFGRLGRLETPHGVVETPALLPVVHPDPARQTIPPKELRERFGFGGVITSSYILWRNPALRERARAKGLHELLGFSGAIMTDSGAFQQHAYGEVEVAPEEILRFQGEIGTDIATVLDRFVEPEAPYEEAAGGVEETLERARAARATRGRALLAVPVQGGLHPGLRERSARASSPIGDVLAVGGIVPLMERYRVGDLVRVLAACRPGLAPERPVHLFGLGHPMLFALGALFGADLFDSSSYHKFAERGTLLFPEGSLALEDLHEEVCACALCEKTPLSQVKDLPERERGPWIARHNLAQCSLEIARVRQAIRDGELWDLVERRSASHPALLAGLQEALQHAELFTGVEPPSRRSFRAVSALSARRPAAVRFAHRLDAWRAGAPVAGTTSARPLSPEALRNAPRIDPSTSSRTGTWDVATWFGPVPLELTEIYPVGPLVAPSQFAPRSAPAPSEPPVGATPAKEGSSTDSPSGAAAAPEAKEDNAEAWVRRHAEGVLAWNWGWTAAEQLMRSELRAVHSRSTRRLRQLTVGGDVLFVVGNDGLPRPTFRGGERLRVLLAPPTLRVTASDDAVPFVSEGRSLFSRHVLGAAPDIVPDQSVLVVDKEDRLLAVGRAVLAGSEMGRLQRGVAVRVVSHARGEPPESEP